MYVCMYSFNHTTNYKSCVKMASSESVKSFSKQSFHPPKPTWRPGKVKVVRALYNYTAQHNDELSFNEGELLYIYDRDTDPNWWKAKYGDKNGLIPSNYVEDQMEEMELPLHEAARRGNISFLQECLKQGVSGTGLDSAGNTPLYWAARGGHLDCVQELLNEKHNDVINAKNKVGDTALHIAASRGHLEVVKLLLSCGANTSFRNNENLLAENLTSKMSIKNIIQLNNKQTNNDENYGYKISDYNDDSD